MSFDLPDKPSRARELTPRRQFLAATAGVAMATMAGCSAVTNQKFEAAPVVLPESAREEVALAETARDSTTWTRSVEEIDGEIAVTNQFAVYSRGGFVALRDDLSFQSTLIEQFIGQVNATDGAGPAVVATASNIGVDEVTFNPVGAGAFTISGDRVSMVAPSGLRSEETVAPISGPFLLGWMTDNPSPVNASSAVENPRTYMVDAKDFFPGLVYDLGRKFDPMNQWMPAGEIPPDLWSPDSQVLVVLGDLSSVDVFGIPEEEMPGEQLKDGDSLQSFNPFLVAAPGSVALRDDLSFLGGIFDAGTPNWVGGATYGLGVLSTPAAEVAGEPVNPLAHVGLADVLTNDQVRQVPMDDPAFDESTEWLSGPTPLSDDGDAGISDGLGAAVREDSPDGTTILDQETSLESFVGVVSGEDGPWGVAVHMARVTSSRSENGTDVVITAGAHSWPVGSTVYFDIDRGHRFSGILGSIIIEARILTASAAERLRPITY